MLKDNFKLLLLLLAALLCQIVHCQQSCPSSDWIENGAFCYLLVNGTTGRSFDEARTDCQGRANGADLLWISTDSELSWFEDYQARAWNIKKNWAQCTDCGRRVEAAWIGAYRDDLGIFRWIRDSQAVEINFKWYFGQPKDTPLDYILADDTGSSIRYRTDTREANRKFWHFCKVQHKEPTTTTPMPTTTLPPYLGPCPTRYWTEQGDSCYLLVKGESGRSVDEAEADCSARSSKAGLLWIETADEAAWVMNNSKSAWNLKRDWSECKDCQSDATAWMSLRRTGDVWTWGAKTGIDQSAVRWFTGHPRATPNDFASLYDTGNSNDLSVRSETAGSKMWHICKFRFRESTATTGPPTTPTPHLGVCPGPEWREFSAWCYLLVKGSSGRTFEQAREDCRSRGTDVDLLWIDADEEETWWVDHSERSWNIKADWSQCTDCSGAEGAWVGMFRDSNGIFRWSRNNKVVERHIDWFLGSPKDPPADYVFLYDTGSQLRFRSEIVSTRLWHFCKTNHSDYTGPSNTPRFTTSTPQPSTTTTTRVTTPTTTPYLGNCPSSQWKEFEHSCYLLVKGSSGRIYSDARADCLSRSADLLWVRSDRELAWIRDGARNWGIKQDWRQCTNCDRIEAAWFGMYRDLQDNKLKWAHDQTEVTVELSWWGNDPLPTPNDYGIIYDPGSQLRFRMQTLDRVLWHFCKIDYSESTATTERPTSSTPGPTRFPPGPCVSTDWTAYGDFCYTLAKGPSGVTWSDALTACKAQDHRAELLWLSSQAELNWLLNNSRNWKLRADYQQCLNCTSVAGAWIGLFRDSTGNFTWKRDFSKNQLDLSSWWYFGHPKSSPNNFVMIHETASHFYLRTEVLSDSYWYFCKYNYRYISTSSTQPSTSTETNPTSITRAPIGPCPESGDRWIEYDGNCYTLRKPIQGHTWSSARDACRSVSESSDLVWLETQSELEWLVDYSARNWGIKADWNACQYCSNVEAAWIGLFRDEGHDGLLKWAFHRLTINIVPNWWPDHPKQSPNNYGLLFDTGSALRMRTEVGTGRYWYFCKAIGNYPATEPTEGANFWNSGAVHVLWIIPVLLVLAGATFYIVRVHRRRSVPSHLESAEQPVMTLENPAFSNYLAMDNANGSTPVNGDSVSVTLKDRLNDDDSA
ncbi:hypothetical protein BOX15_Mlig021682g1 [Macrostomum lignano]|uniref:C-type lectin domain-containing protein n=1 Tax=Macrostomum lignano TaxID=282301 RepID=A0A267GFV9_9PLAT|nr:hypothetical protein BOX15_Mlig021682g1 [Macrostomum lignano]